MKTKFKTYLRFNRKERMGTLALLLIATFLFGIPEIARHLRAPEHTDFEPFKQEIQAFRQALNSISETPSPALFAFDPNTASFDDFIRLGLSEKVANIICNYRDKGGDFREAADLQKIWSLKPEDYQRLMPYIQIGAKGKFVHQTFTEKPESELFAFDPNTASAADFERMGLPERSIKSILNYREKGGQFRKKEDLEKIYTLSAEDFARISTYATFSEACVASAKTRPTAYAAGAAFPTKKSEGPVDINRASLDAWRTLPGIGETRARQLINYREKLGGFLSIAQISEVSGLPDSVLQAIKPLLVLQGSDIRRINLNTASVQDLDAHPYISRRQAELIVAYREQHGAFAAVEDIEKMRAISDKAWLNKVKPYLGVN